MEIRGLIQSLAMKHFGVELGVACKGTSIESTTYNTRKKAFLFVGSKDARLKRADGWIKIDLSAPPAEGELDSWIAESYELITSATPMPPPPPEKPVKPVKKPRVARIAESVDASTALKAAAPVAKAGARAVLPAPKPVGKTAKAVAPVAKNGAKAAAAPVAKAAAKPVAKAAAKPVAKAAAKPVAKAAAKPIPKPAKKTAAKPKKR